MKNESANIYSIKPPIERVEVQRFYIRQKKNKNVDNQVLSNKEALDGFNNKNIADKLFGSIAKI